MQTQIATLIEKGDEMARSLTVTVKSNLELVNAINTLDLKVDKNFEANMKVGNYHQECIEQFEFIKLSDSRTEV